MPPEVPRKLRPSTYKAWWDLHAWAGVVASLVAYVMFYFGAWTLFYAPLLNWQEPRGPVPTFAEVDRVIDAAIERGQVSPTRVRIFLPRERAPGFSATYSDEQGRRQHRLIERGGLVEARSGVADFFYGMHFLQPPSAPGWLYVAAGLVAGSLLLVIVTGTLIQMRQLVAQLHQFRPHKGVRVALSDAHKVLGVFGLPFVAVYAFSGAWLGLDSVLAPRLAQSVFAGNAHAASVAQYGPARPKVAPSGTSAPRRPLAELLARAQREPLPLGVERHDANDCRSVHLHHVGDRDGTAEFQCGPSSVLLRQRDASLVAPAHAPTTWLTRLGEVPYAVHFAELARWPLRLLYALLTLAGCGAILTGNWLWLEGRAAHAGTKVLQKLTVGTVAGSLVASAAMLGSTRLAESSALELWVFWGSWLLVAVGCALQRVGVDAWRRSLQLAGVLFVATPVLGAARLGRSERNPLLPGTELMDIALLALGLICFALSVTLARRQGQRAACAQGGTEGTVGVA
jgi:uncharacterized iron-regulated membrane protein